MKKILYSGLDNIGDVVNSIVKRTDLQNGIQKSMLFKFWGKIVGKKFEKITRPVSINNKNELIVACANSMVTSELLLFKADIQKKMQPYTKSLDIDISDIVFSHKIWKEDDATLEVRMMFSGTYTLVSVKHNGKADPKFIRDYSSPKRAMSAIRTMVLNAGFSW